MAKRKSDISLPVDPEVLDALIERDLSFIEGLVDDTRKKIMDILTDGITRGLNPRDLIDDLMELGYDAARAESIARTETLYALNEGAKSRYREVDIEYVEWLATDDERTCDDVPMDLPDGSTIEGGCAEMSGKIFKINDAPPMPGHVRCRCCWLPSEGPEAY